MKELVIVFQLNRSMWTNYYCQYLKAHNTFGLNTKVTVDFEALHKIKSKHQQLTSDRQRKHRPCTSDSLETDIFTHCNVDVSNLYVGVYLVHQSSTVVSITLCLDTFLNLLDLQITENFVVGDNLIFFSCYFILSLQLPLHDILKYFMYDYFKKGSFRFKYRVLQYRVSVIVQVFPL